MRNKRRVTALVAIACAVIIAAGGLMASNMGFKLNYPLQAASVGVSNSGTQTIGLPYNRQVGINNASTLLADIQASGVAAVSLQRFNPVSDQNDPYPGGPTAVDFALQAGEGYLVKVQNSGPYIIVGSHDPGFTVALKGPAVGVSNSGTSRYVHPYHGVSAVASQLITETGAIGMQKFNPVSDQNDPYPGGPTAVDFALVPGEAYLIKVLSDTNFVPAHY
jgi:hypothetical protein